MLKKIFIGGLCLLFCSLVPIQSYSASIISNGVRNFVADEIGSSATEYAITNDNQSDHEAAVVEGVSKAAGAAATIGTATVGAAAAGAGSLAGYAGMASAVSSLGLSSVTATGASLLGSSATGAAATAVCTAAVGGPVVMGAIIVGGVGAVGYGAYRAGSYLMDTDAGKWASDKTLRAWDWLKSKW